MKLNFGGVSLRVDMSFAAVVTLVLILDESGMCAIALFCCIVHEIGHIICLAALGERPSSLRLSFYGIKLEREMITRAGRVEEIAVFASGPGANIMLSAVLFPMSAHSAGLRTAAVISLFVGLFNLLPCYPLDGGNILFTVLCRFMQEEHSEKVCGWVAWAVLAPMGAAGLALTLRSGNFTLLAAASYLAWVSLMNKKDKNNVRA